MQPVPPWSAPPLLVGAVSAGSCCLAHNLWIWFIYFSSQLCCHLRFQNSPQTCQCKCFLVFGNLRLPSWDGSPSLPLLSLFLSFIVCPTSFWRQPAAFLGVWCPLPAFRSCFVEFSQCSNVLSMNSWGRKGSPHPIPLPSWDPPIFIHSDAS